MVNQSWFQSWVEKTHPVRALLALGSLAVTGYMVVNIIPVPDAWWVIVTGLALFYVEAFRPSSPTA